MKTILIIVAVVGIALFLYRNHLTVDSSTQQFARVLDSQLPKNLSQGGRRGQIEVTSDGKGLVVPVSYPSSFLPADAPVKMKEVGPLFEEILRQVWCKNGHFRKEFSFSTFLAKDRYVLFEIKVDGQPDLATFDMDEYFCDF